jgi:VIT1/CCC1 family predicted Fe2+/Mn2+ transporter
MFGMGALLPLLPWLLAGGTGAIVASVILGTLGSLGIGAALAYFTKKTWWRSALRQLLISTVAAGVTFGVGALVGTTVHH